MWQPCDLAMPLILLWAIALSSAAESPDATSKNPDVKVRALNAAALKGLDAAALTAVVTEPLALTGAATDGLIFERTTDGQSDLWQVRLSDSPVRRLLDTPDRNDLHLNSDDEILESQRRGDGRVGALR